MYSNGSGAGWRLPNELWCGREPERGYLIFDIAVNPDPEKTLEVSDVFRAMRTRRRAGR